ncbi:MAG: hypothetical protein VW127_08300 [Flavobacteriaceae bacterium]
MKKYLFVVLSLSLACKKEVIPDPEAAVLIAPENNNNCSTAIVISDQQSQVNFSWEEALHTNEYELVVRDILTNMDQKKLTLRLLSSVVLNRGKQYAWWVNSKSDQTETITKSQVRTFYLEGVQTSRHFPFPAKLISPENNAQVSLVEGELSLSWEGSDLDNDIASYDVYLGLDIDDLNLVAEDLTVTSVRASLNENEYYYWRILTRDEKGNISHSPVGFFRTSL